MKHAVIMKSIFSKICQYALFSTIVIEENFLYIGNLIVLMLIQYQNIKRAKKNGTLFYIKASLYYMGLILLYFVLEELVDKVLFKKSKPTL